MPSELPLWLSSPIYMLAFSRVTQSETLLGFETEKSERPGVDKVEGTWDREMLMPLFSSCATPVLAKSSVAQPKFHPATCCMKFNLFEFVLCFMNQGENNLNFQCRIVYFVLLSPVQHKNEPKSTWCAPAGVLSRPWKVRPMGTHEGTCPQFTSRARNIVPSKESVLYGAFYCNTEISIHSPLNNFIVIRTYTQPAAKNLSRKEG